MPLYEYQCMKCSQVFEAIVNVDKEDHWCPYCDGMGTRIPSVPGGFKLKGKGFYANDYKKKEVKKDAEGK